MSHFCPASPVGKSSISKHLWQLNKWCVCPVTCWKSPCWCLSEVENCQLCVVHPIWNDMCPKLIHPWCRLTPVCEAKNDWWWPAHTHCPVLQLQEQFQTYTYTRILQKSFKTIWDASETFIFLFLVSHMASWWTSEETKPKIHMRFVSSVYVFCRWTRSKNWFGQSAEICTDSASFCHLTKWQKPVHTLRKLFISLPLSISACLHSLWAHTVCFLRYMIETMAGKCANGMNAWVITRNLYIRFALNLLSNKGAWGTHPQAQTLEQMVGQTE